MTSRGTWPVIRFAFVGFVLFVVPIVRASLAFGLLRIGFSPRRSRRARRPERRVGGFFRVVRMFGGGCRRSASVARRS